MILDRWGKLGFILENIITLSSIIPIQFYRPSCPSQPQEITRMFRIIQQRGHGTSYLIWPRENFYNSMVKFYCIWIDFGVLHLDGFWKFTVLLELVNSDNWKKKMIIISPRGVIDYDWNKRVFAMRGLAAELRLHFASRQNITAEFYLFMCAE